MQLGNFDEDCRFNGSADNYNTWKRYVLGFLRVNGAANVAKAIMEGSKRSRIQAISADNRSPVIHTFHLFCNRGTLANCPSKPRTAWLVHSWHWIPSTLLLSVSVVSRKDTIFDLNSAFLNAPLHDDVFVRPVVGSDPDCPLVMSTNWKKPSTAWSKVRGILLSFNVSDIRLL